MKKVKLAAAFFLLFTTFVLCGELYQKYLGTYTNQFNYFDISCEDADERREAFELLKSLSDQYNLQIFMTSKKTDDAFSYHETIYCSDEVYNTLKEDYEVRIGRFKSLFSGDTEITVENYDSAAENLNAERCYFIGDYKNVQIVREFFNTSFGSSYIHKEATSSYHWLIICLWLIVGLLICLLTWLDIQFQKKENFVLISLGVSRFRIIIKNIITDFSAYFLIYSVLFFTLKNYTYLGYRLAASLPLFIASVILSSLLYLSLYKIDYKQALYGANINESTVSNGYLLKALTMFVTVVVLSSNIILITSNYKSFSQLNELKQFSDYSFLSLERYNLSYENDDEEYYENTLRQIYADYYKQNKVASASNMFETDEWECVLINNNSIELIADINEVKNLSLNKDCYIFMPSGCTDREKTETLIKDVVYMDFYGLENADFEIVTYKSNKEILSVNYSEAPGSLGFRSHENPIIVYCNFSPEILKSLDSSMRIPGSNFSDIMFNISEQDIKDLEQKYDTEAHGCYFVRQSVNDRFEHFEASLFRIVLLNSIISVLMIALEATIISTLIKMEYKAHSIELAVKKTLGYSIFQKNKSLFFLNTYAAVIGVATVIVISLMYKFSLWYVVLISGIALLALEYLIIVLNILKFEKTNIAKILKGGSL